MRVAIVGGGLAGLSTTSVLSRRHDITLYEAGARLGGHALTVHAPRSDGGLEPVDVGFILLHRDYSPALSAAFVALGVERTAARHRGLTVLRGNGVEWTTNGHETPFARRVVGEARRLDASCARMVEDEAGIELSIGDYLRREGFTDEFARNCVDPFVSVV